jgi:arginine:ornithine antiporter / lysine permease
MAAEVLYIPAKTDDMPRFVARTNSHGAPVAALIMAAGLLKLTITRETYGDEKSFVPDMIVAAVATVYTLFLIYAAGVDKLLLSCILYAPAPPCTSRRAANAVCGCFGRRKPCCSA